MKSEQAVLPNPCLEEEEEDKFLNTVNCFFFVCDEFTYK
jgi:hypothetical protein